MWGCSNSAAGAWGKQLEGPKIYCAEKIVIPQNLDEVLKLYTKEAIRVGPQDLYAFSAEYALPLRSSSPPSRFVQMFQTTRGTAEAEQ